mgnify:CR=1 FL=1
MAIGSNITVSVPTVGTTVYTLAKASDGVYQDATSVTNSNGDVMPVHLTLRASRVSGAMRSINAVLRHRPAAFDGILGSSQGQVTVSMNVTGTIGENISQTDIRTYVQYLASVLTQSGIIDALLSGSYE